MHLFLVGAGPVGLVTAAGFARLGHRVTVSDIDESRIGCLRDGRAPIFEPGLDEALATFRETLHFTTNPVPPADVSHTVVCVGTPADPSGGLSLAQVETVVAGLLATAPVGHVVVVRSTLPMDGPDLLLRLLAEREAVAGRGMCPTVVTNPEFMREGRGLDDFERPSRVVTGWLRPGDRAAAEGVAALYAPLGAPTLVADARSVALIKLASNVFLATKIAFADELARLCDRVGANVDTVTEGVGLDDRIGRGFLGAGPGFGGSCLPEQAIALPLYARSVGVDAPVISAANASNERHQRAIVDRIAVLLSTRDDGRARLFHGASVTVLGLAFKANTDDVRFSPALALARLFREKGARVVGYDPRADVTARRADPQLETAPSPVAAASHADAVVVATEWAEFRSLDWAAMAAAMRGTLVYDARNVVDRAAVQGAGLRLEVLGRPEPAD
jgi:UDPglucose 6-dehydrogenase